VASGTDAGEHPPDSGVAAAVTVIAAQRRVDGDATDALGCPALDLGSMRFNGGDRAAGPTGLADRRAQRRIVWQRCIGRQPALRGGQPAESGHLRAAHQPRPRDISIRVALAQPHQDLAILEHLKSPSTHRLSRRQKPTA